MAKPMKIKDIRNTFLKQTAHSAKEKTLDALFLAAASYGLKALFNVVKQPPEEMSKKDAAPEGFVDR
ncbi:MAG: hypothetical protein Q4C56_08220 [Peptococcaceae bacterium]|nr:hypothetical protein [Peptococcaceae bacterium]